MQLATGSEKATWLQESRRRTGFRQQFTKTTLHSDLAIWGTDCYRLCSLPSYLCHPLRDSVARYSVVLFASTAPGVSSSTRYVTLNNPPTLSGPYFSHLQMGLIPVNTLHRAAVGVGGLEDAMSRTQCPVQSRPLLLPPSPPLLHSPNFSVPAMCQTLFPGTRSPEAKMLLVCASRKHKER